MSKKAIAIKVREYLRRSGAQLSPQAVSKAVRDSIVEHWENVGLKEYYHGRPDLAGQKIDAYLSKLHS